MRSIPILIFLVSCGPNLPDPVGTTEIAEELQYDYYSWADEMRRFDIDVSRLSQPHKIHYVSEIDGGFVGLCVTYGDDSFEIYIQKRKSDLARNIVMWHELGHCVLGMDHWLDRPDDIMFPYLALSTRAWKELEQDAKNRYIEAAMRGAVEE